MLIFLCEALAVSYQAWYNKALKWLYFAHFDMLKKKAANEFAKAYLFFTLAFNSNVFLCLFTANPIKKSCA